MSLYIHFSFLSIFKAKAIFKAFTVIISLMFLQQDDYKGFLWLSTMVISFPIH